MIARLGSAPLERPKIGHAGEECSGFMQFLEKEDETPAFGLIEKRNRLHKDSLRRREGANESRCCPGQSSVQEAGRGIVERKFLEYSRVAQIEHRVERNTEAENFALLGHRREFRGAIGIEMASPFGDEDAFISGEIECRFSRHIPAVELPQPGHAKVERIERPVCGNMPVRDARPGSDELLDGQS
jgi:hypothetical protein